MFQGFMVSEFQSSRFQVPDSKFQNPGFQGYREGSITAKRLNMNSPETVVIPKSPARDDIMVAPDVNPG
jgi:hypothetical protein